MDTITRFINEVLSGPNDRWIVIIVVAMIILFSLAIVMLFFTALFIRIGHFSRRRRRDFRHRSWEPNILAVMDGSAAPADAYKAMKHTQTVDYLLYLEEYLDLVKGREQQRLRQLARLSSNRIIDLIRDHDHDKRMYGIHLLSVLDTDVQYAYLKFVLEEGKNRDLALITVREVSQAGDPRIAALIMKNLSFFHYLNPQYFCTILAENGPLIIPYIRKEFLNPQYGEKEIVIMIETLSRLHDTSCLDMTTFMLRSDNHPDVLSSWLRYLNKVAGSEYHAHVKMFVSHKEIPVRQAAAGAYLATVSRPSARDILFFLDDESIWVAMEAVKKVRLMNVDIPIGEDSLSEVRHGELYARWEV